MEQIRMKHQICQPASNQKESHRLKKTLKIRQKKTERDPGNPLEKDSSELTNPVKGMWRKKWTRLPKQKGHIVLDREHVISENENEPKIIEWTGKRGTQDRESREWQLQTLNSFVSSQGP